MRKSNKTNRSIESNHIYILKLMKITYKDSNVARTRYLPLFTLVVFEPDTNAMEVMQIILHISSPFPEAEHFKTIGLQKTEYYIPSFFST